MALFPIVLFMLTEGFTQTETWLASNINFLGEHIVRGLGGTEVVDKTFSWIFGTVTVQEATNVKWISGIYGAGIGAFFGCWFSCLAITGDKRFAWLWKVYIEFTAIKSTTFYLANLTGAIFRGSTVQSASFNEAMIAKIRWDNTKCLDCACVGSSYLKYPQVRSLVVTREWERQDNNSSKSGGINLEEANLQDASFIGTNLAKANLQSATLTDAILKKANLEGANLKGANLTGACIQAWTIDETTELNDIVCKYIYLKNTTGQKTGIK